MRRYKLQLRVIVLITSITLFLIVLFTSIQLKNHLDRLRSYNHYRARVGTIIVKSTLEMLIKAIESKGALTGIFKAAVSSFSREGVVEKMSIISIDGSAIATNDPVVKRFGEAKKDIETYMRLSSEEGRDMWFFSTFNEKTKNIDIYIPLQIGLEKAYIAKLSFSIGNIQEALLDILVPISLTAIAVIIGNIFLGTVLFRTVVRPINALNTATKDIASGNFDHRVEIRTNDEIEELGETFNVMTLALKKMRERAENANPLTALPGNNVIREEIENRIKQKEKFAAVHIDLDNFKAYNDRYGVAKGDEVIKFTSELLKDAVEEKGAKDDLVGHEGGDDFFVITPPDKVEDIAHKIILDFDSQIRNFYSREDQKKGHILEKDRRGEMMKYPFMTISLAGVSNKFRQISSYGELTNIAVGVMHKAKEMRRSNFILDRRRDYVP